MAQSNVFRLLRVPATKLVGMQGRLQAQRRIGEQTLEQTRRELAEVQDFLARKEQDVESRSRTVEGTLQAVSQLQVMLGEKAKKLEEQQRQAEQLLQQLSMKLQRAEVQRDDRERSGDRILRRIVQRLEPCKYVGAGMTKDDVVEMLGLPDGMELDTEHFHEEHPKLLWKWLYGGSVVEFNSYPEALVGCRRFR